MPASHFITITVCYEPGVSHGTSLAWIAPELQDVPLRLVEDHLEAPVRARTWSGPVDESTFERFSAAWRLERSDEELTGDGTEDRHDRVGYSRTLDGMNWETEGHSPIISVSVRVVRPRYAKRRGARGCSTRGGRRATGLPQ
jgi:hypothetical protein